MNKDELSQIIQVLNQNENDHEKKSDTAYKLIDQLNEDILMWEKIELIMPVSHLLVLHRLLEVLKYLNNKIPEAMKQLTNYNESVLYTSLKLEAYEIARYLIELDLFQEFGHQFTKGGQTAFTIACDTYECPEDLVVLLLQKGRPDKEELKLGLCNAIRSRNIKAAIVILNENNSLVNEILDKDSGKYFMHLLVENHRKTDAFPKTIREMYGAKISWKVVDNQQCTIFHAAIKYKLPTPEIFNFLDIFRSCFDPNIQDAKGNTLLHTAVAWNSIDVVRYCCETLKINPRIKNHDIENPLKSAIYRATHGDWEIYNDIVTYLIVFMFQPPDGSFCFEEILDLVNLTSLNRFYQPNRKLYPLLIDLCYKENNSYANLIREILLAFRYSESGVRPDLVILYLHDKAKLYPEYQMHRRAIVREIQMCALDLIYNTTSESFTILSKIIIALQKTISLSMSSGEFENYSNIYYDRFYFIFNQRSSINLSRHLEFYEEFHSLSLINFDTIVDISLCKIMFHSSTSYEEKYKMIESGLFQAQLNLAQTVTLRPKGVLKELYGTKEFKLIKTYLEQMDFNRVCFGKEIMTLKLMSRSVCRKVILKENIKGKERKKTIQTVGLPKSLEDFLQYLE